MVSGTTPAIALYSSLLPRTPVAGAPAQRTAATQHPYDTVIDEFACFHVRATCAQNVFENVADATRILREIKLLRLLKHPGTQQQQIEAASEQNTRLYTEQGSHWSTLVLQPGQLRPSPAYRVGQHTATSSTLAALMCLPLTCLLPCRCGGDQAHHVAARSPHVQGLVRGL